MRRYVVVTEELVTHHLEKDVGVAVAALLGDDQLLNNRLRSADKPDTHTGRKNLGVGAVIDHDTIRKALLSNIISYCF